MKDSLVPRLALVLVAVRACDTQGPDPGAAQAAALAASAAYDALDELDALDNPDAPGARDAFRGATVDALDRAVQAHRTARRATSEPHRRSLHAAELADRFGLAMADALKARAVLEAAVADTLEARLILQEAAYSQAEVELLAAEDEAARRLGFGDAEALGKAYDEASRRFLDRPPLRNSTRAERYDGLSLPAMLNRETERERSLPTAPAVDDMRSLDVSRQGFRFCSNCSIPWRALRIESGRASSRMGALPSSLRRSRRKEANRTSSTTPAGESSPPCSSTTTRRPRVTTHSDRSGPLTSSGTRNRRTACVFELTRETLARIGSVRQLRLGHRAGPTVLSPASPPPCLRSWHVSAREPGGVQPRSFQRR